MAWLYLFLAGLFEIGWPVGFKLSQQPQWRLAGIAGAVACMAVSGFLLWLAQKQIPIGTAYAVWTGIGAALTVGVRRGSVLLSLLVLPLYIPVLIFGAGAVDATVSGVGAQAHLSLLGALTLGGVFFAPWPTAAALRIALE